MKIRTDFVTNSSSVSFIITMSEEMVDIMEKQYLGDDANEKKRISDLLKKKFTEEGTKCYLEGRNIYTKEIKFRDDSGEAIDKEALYSEYPECDFNELPDEVLWQYILGEYLLKDKINEIRGFGATLVNLY